MLENNIFPESIIKNSVEYHIAKHNNRSVIVYWIVIVSFIIGLASLPFIKVKLYSTSPSVITSAQKKVAIYPPSSGLIEVYNIRENKNVKKGDTLVIINQKIIHEKIKLSEHQTEELEVFIADLDKLLNNRYSSLKSFKYKQEHQEFSQKLNASRTLLNKAIGDFERTKILYKKGVISLMEYEKDEFSLNKLKDDRQNTIRQYKLKWQNEITQSKQNLDRSQSELNQFNEEKNKHVITASIDGELTEILEVNIGTFVAPNLSLAKISPSKNLIVESYVTTSDIGFLKNGNTVKYQVDAFNYNQWGFASGRIIEIGKDVTIVDGTSYFKVKSSLDQDHLTLKNGYVGSLKKGLTLTSRFFISERSLFQLLNDKVNDWFNPYNNKNNG